MKIAVFSLASGMAKGTALTKAYAANAERLGFSTLWVPEHVVLLDKYASRYPYSENGILPAPTRVSRRVAARPVWRVQRGANLRCFRRERSLRGQLVHSGLLEIIIRSRQ